MADKCRVAVVGAGWWSTQHHIPSLLAYEPADLVAVVDPDSEKLEAVSRHFGIKSLYRDLDAALRETDVQGVILAVPHALHYALAKRVLESGVHLMVEKPMTLHAQEAWDLVRIAAEANLNLVVGYPWNYTAQAAWARRFLGGGGIGQIQLIHGLFASMVIEYLRGNPDAYRSVFNFPVTGPGPATYSDPALAGGGQGHLQITHLAGLLLWVTGLSPQTVYARMNRLDCQVDVVDAMTVEFQGGALGSIASTGNIAPNHGEEHEIRIYGDEGSMILRPIRGQVAVKHADGRVEEIPDLDAAARYPAGATSRSLVDLILGRGQNCAPGELGARVVSLLDAAYESQRQGMAVRALTG